MARQIYLIASLGLLVLSLPKALGIEIIPSTKVIGKSPAIIGYNVAHFFPGSNTDSWWRYSQVNGARLWSSPSTIEPLDDNAVWGDGVDTEEAFLNRRKALRDDPLNISYVNWPYFNDHFENSTTEGNILQVEYAIERLSANGIELLVIIDRSAEYYPFSAKDTKRGWADRWEHWQHFYAQTFHLASRFDVVRYQCYNEPDHHSKSVSQADYIERVLLSSDAVRSAIEDVNRIFNKKLVPEFQAPVTAGGSNKFFSDSKGDHRDNTIGWGELITKHRHANFLGAIDPDIDAFSTYAYQRYNLTPKEFGKDLAQLKTELSNTSSESPLKVALTEFNVFMAARFAEMDESLETPWIAARFGALLSSLAENQPDELYIFKFGQTSNYRDGAVKKNGVHFVDNRHAPYGVGGVTLGGEVVRLFSKGFRGSRDLLSTTISGVDRDNDVQVITSYDQATHRYYFLSTNSEHKKPVDLSFNLRGLHVAKHAPMIIEEVSEQLHGGVAYQSRLPETEKMIMRQPANSVWLMTIIDEPQLESTVLHATDDALVKAGSNSAKGYGANPNLRAKNEPRNPNARNASFIKFDLSTISPQNVSHAVLKVTGSNEGRAPQVIAHVYGIEDDSWTEDSISWVTAPNLAAADGEVSEIQHNSIEGVGDSAEVLGHLTAGPENAQLMLDVSGFVRNHPDREVSFLIAREVRFDGENVEDDETALLLTSKERADESGPRLIVFYKKDTGHEVSR